MGQWESHPITCTGPELPTWAQPRAGHDLDAGESWVGINVFLVSALAGVPAPWMGQEGGSGTGRNEVTFPRRLALGLESHSGLPARSPVLAVRVQGEKGE